mmetsp:Transcript_4664/g.13810  ORF Transcript_4664/g.13810 Transcript_4664/m.13810 type:complete len:379 (+) Transcript_4664:138-1274(+)
MSSKSAAAPRAGGFGDLVAGRGDARAQQSAPALVPDRSGALALDEALDAGRRTLQTLEEQGEQLRKAELVADSNQYLVDRSARVVRGMTWGGWLRNQFTTLPAPKPPPERRARDPIVARPPPPEPENESTCPARREQDAYVRDLSRGLDDVLDCGTAIGDCVDEQNETAPRLLDTMDRLWESTRRATRAAGRLTAGSAGDGEPRLLGHVALFCPRTRRYVRARGQDVGLSDEVGVLRATSRFALYEKRPHVLGLRSPVAGRWLGLRFSGAIGCTSSSCSGSWQEFDLDLRPPRAGGAILSPLSCLGANWGGGCYVKVDAREGWLLCGEPLGDPAARRRARHFEVHFLDGSHSEPAYAEEEVRAVPQAPVLAPAGFEAG